MYRAATITSSREIAHISPRLPSVLTVNARMNSTLHGPVVATPTLTPALQRLSKQSPYVVGYDEFLAKVQNRSKADTILIDVRSEEEFLAGCVPSAVNLPITELSDALQLPRETFLQRFGFEKPLKTQEIVFYCLKGIRSTKATEHASSIGYTMISNYKGSWTEWTARAHERM